MNNKVIISAVFALAISFVAHGKPLGDRPVEVRSAIDKTFDAFKNMSNWGECSGTNNYRLLGIDDDLLIKSVVFGKTGQDIYIIDVGCGNGEWGLHALEFLQQNKSNNRIHIYSLTGGNECENKTVFKGNAILYQFNQFNIDNIDEGFVEKGLNLKGKIDLIVSRRSIQYFSDQFGTIKQMANLLTPSHGVLFSDGFLFGLEGRNSWSQFPRNSRNGLNSTNHCNIFSNNSGFDVLFMRRDDDKDATEHFVLRRKSIKEIDLPLSYAGVVPHPFDRELLKMAMVKKKFVDSGKIEPANSKTINSPYYCGDKDAACRSLYQDLKPLISQSCVRP